MYFLFVCVPDMIHISSQSFLSWILRVHSTSVIPAAPSPCVPISFTWGVTFFNSPTTIQSATPWGMGSDFPRGRLPSSSLMWIGVNSLWGEFWPMESGDERNKFSYHSKLLLTLPKHNFSIDSVQKYLTWPSIWTRHMRDKLCHFVAHHKAVAWIAMHHSALASHPSPFHFCFLWDCTF